MAGRRAFIDDSSLELLLDTITNAFGGILFLAILVVVLLQGTSETVVPEETVPPVNVAESTGRLEELEAEAATLGLELEAMDAISSNLANSEFKSTLAQLQQQRQIREVLTKERKRLQLGIENAKEKLAAAQEQDRSLSGDIASESAKITALQGELERERARRKINSPFPEERSATKRSRSVTIRYGRWYEERTPAGVPNLEDFAVLDSEGMYLTVTPKPYRGIPLVENGGLAGRIISRLSSFDSQRDYVDVSIWDDSYEEFQSLRDYLVENNYEYRLIIVGEDGEVVEGFVADPKVQ